MGEGIINLYMETQNDKFSIEQRVRSVGHAVRGLTLFFKTTHNAWVQIIIGTCAVALGIYVNLTTIEWLFLVCAIGLVLVAEAFNTAIEIDIDLTSPEFHPYARDTKDVAAGAVLLAAMTAVVIGMLVFVPHLLLQIIWIVKG